MNCGCRFFGGAGLLVLGFVLRASILVLSGALIGILALGLALMQALMLGAAIAIALFFAGSLLRETSAVQADADYRRRLIEQRNDAQRQLAYDPAPAEVIILEPRPAPRRRA